MKNKLCKIGLTFLIPASLVLAFFASKINTGALELSRWDKHVLSTHTALFFFIIMAVAGMGGYIASKQKSKRRKLIINVVALSLAMLLAGILSTFQPFLGYIGR